VRQISRRTKFSQVAVTAAVVEGKAWAVGVDSGQYRQSSLAGCKDHILGSALKNVGGAVYDLGKSVVEGKPESGVVEGTLRAGGVGFSDSNPKYRAMKDVVAAVEKAERDIIAGKVTVSAE
jgi:basic membrane protein A and related proteins